VQQLPATHRRPERRRPRARHRLSPPATCPLGVCMRRASSLIAHGLSSKPSPFPSPREATLPPCSSSRSTLPLVASADDRAVSAASGYLVGALVFKLELCLGGPPRDPTPSSPSDVRRPPLPLSHCHRRRPPLATNYPHRRLHELLTEVEPLTNHSSTIARPPVPSPVAGSPLPKHAAVGSHCLVSPSFSMRLQ
jgi:hypothetical protein